MKKQRVEECVSDQTCFEEEEAAAVTAAAACEADDGSGVCITLEEDEEGVQLT